jgi:hypothetical protein
LWVAALALICFCSLPARAQTGPSIVTQPVSQVVTNESPASFSVEATGTEPLTYQWRRNGVAIPYATGTNFTIDWVGADTVGLYSVAISNAVGTVVSSEVSLSLDRITLFFDDFESGNMTNWTVVSSASALTPAVDLASPAGGIYTAFLDTSVDKMYRKLGQRAEGRARLSFWMFNTNQPQAYCEARTYAGSSYGGTVVQLLAAGFHNSATMPGEVYSDTNFQGRVYAGTNAGWFTLNNPGTPPRSAAWHHFIIEKSSDETYFDIYVDGVLGRRMSCTPVAWDFVTIGSVGPGGGTPGFAWFDDVQVEYLDPPRIVRQPVGQWSNIGGTANFNVSATNNVRGYQWRFNGEAIDGATSSSLIITNCSEADSGSYDVVVLNALGASVSEGAVLLVSHLDLPVITTHPTNSTVNQGQPASFNVTATGGEPLSFRWFKVTQNSTNAISNGGTISGADTPTLNFSSVSEVDAGSYQVKVSNPAALVVSSNAILNVILPPQIVTQPQSVTWLANQTGTLSVSAVGGALNYQWYFNDQLVSGATAPSLILTNVQPAQSGNYFVVVSNSAGMQTSAVATLAVHYYLSALGSGGSVHKQPSQLSYAPGTQVQLTAEATPNYLFQNWSGHATGTNNPTLITMDGHKNVRAVFSNAVPNGKVIRDGNIDPSNLGKGDWIYFISAATNKLGGNVPSVTNENSLMLWYKKHGIRYIIVKAGDNQSLFNGSYNRPQLTNTFIDIAHSHGLLVFGYNRSYGQNITAEIQIADYVFNQGADGFVFDAEAEWESGNWWITNGPLQAWKLCGAVRTNWPNKFLAHSPFAILSIHDGSGFNFPYKQFGYWCDVAMPMIYHYNWAGRSPSGAINWTDVGWLKWNQTCAHPTNNPAFFAGSAVYWTNAIKPHAPVNHVYGPNPPNSGVSQLEPDDVAEFADYLSVDPHCPSPGGYSGCSFWRTDLHGAAQWTNIGAITSGNFPGIVNNIVVDDNKATFTGTWTHVRTFYNGGFVGPAGSDTNSFGTNYFTMARGDGSSFAQFTPNITVAGHYDVFTWHPRRSNTSTNVPFQITFSGGTTNLWVNQKTNSGSWVRLGQFKFETGASGNIQIRNDFPEVGAVAMADAIKLVYVPRLEMRQDSLAMLPDGRMQFEIRGVPGSVVEVQSCADLSWPSWQPVATNTLGTTGTELFAQPTLQGAPRYYRLRWEQ